MKMLKNVVIRATALLVFTAMICAVILWQAGVYDVSFIKRPSPFVSDTVGTDTGEGTDTVPSDTSESTGTEMPTDTDFPTDTTISDEEAEKLLDMILSYAEMQKSGWLISDGIFGESSSIARLDFDIGDLKNKLPAREVTESKVVLYQKADGYWTTKTVKEKVTLPSVRLYFGLIFLDNGKTVSVYNSDGRRLIKSFDGILVYGKTEAGDPAVKIGEKYYGINSDTGLSAEVSADSIRIPSLEFDHPSYFAPDMGLYPFSQYVEVLTEITTEPPTTEPADTDPTDTSDDDISEPADTSEDNGTEPPETTESGDTEPPETSEDTSSDAPDTSDPEPVTSDTIDIDLSEQQNLAKNAVTTEIDGKLYSVETVLMWGYRDAEGNTVIEPQFKAAHDFSSEGLAAVVDFKDRMIFIDRNGKTVITLEQKETVYIDKNTRVIAHQLYGEPVTVGIESLGSFYFDRGYVMVRYILRGTRTKKVVVTENRLLARDGSYFDIPSGYTLQGYSDGALLLEKNGSYGLMDLDGGWIVPAIYSSATPFVSGLSVIGNSDGKFGVINTKGELVLPMCFDYISVPSSGIVAAYSETRGWELYCTVSK